MVVTRASRRRSEDTSRRRLEDGIRRAPRTVRSSTGSTSKPKFSGITISTWNVVDGRSSRLEMACNKLQRLNIDIALLTETKLNGYHTVHSYDYDIVATKCTNQHQGGVALLYRKNSNWHIKSPQTFGSNIIKCTLVHAEERTVIVGMYIPPSEENMNTIRELDQALNNVDVKNLVLLGDFNVSYNFPKDDRAINIVDSI